MIGSIAFGSFVALIVTIITGYFILKKYKAQAVLLCGGFIMMAIALMLGFGPLVPAKSSTHNLWFDMFKFVDDLAGSRTGGLGLMIMACAGFAKYMNIIGASEAMVKVAAKPLHFIKSPYIVLCAGFLLGQVLHPFIPSASGFGLLLMVTLYPLYVSLGISPVTATAVIATNGCLDLGPSSGNSVLAAKHAGMTPVEYFVNYQLPEAIAISLVMMVAHFFVSRYFEKKHKASGEYDEIAAKVVHNTDDSKKVPGFYAILPAVPLILVLLFGYFKVGGIDMGINVALFIGIFISMICEFVRTWNLKEVLGSLQGFFDGMGKQFATVVTLIIAGEVFAKGLSSLGAIKFLIESATHAGLGETGMIIVMCIIIAVCTIVMGSGNAPFFAFSAFAPEVAKRLGIEAVNVLLPMQLTASVLRAASPITAVVVAVSGVAGVSPFAVVKQTMIPLICGAITIQIVLPFLFG